MAAEELNRAIQSMLAMPSNIELTLAAILFGYSLLAVRDGCLKGLQFPVSFLALYWHIAKS